MSGSRKATSNPLVRNSFRIHCPEVYSITLPISAGVILYKYRRREAHMGNSG